MAGNLALSSVLAPLAGLGIDITGQLQQILNEVNHRLKEQYNYLRPTSAPNLLPAGFFFTELEHRTIGAQQYVWERGMFFGRYYRIRPRTGWPMRWFLWTSYSSEDQAHEHWNGFIALMEAREGIPALINAGEQRVDTGTPLIKIRCKGCQALNDESAKFCNQCGSPI